jgi:superoxide dismutase, Cu-Zn family
MQEMQRLGSCFLSVAALAALAGCSTTDSAAVDEAPPAARSVSADLRDASGNIRARGTAEQVGDGIRVRIEAAGLAPGAYGAHVHTTGRCDPPGFTTAGGHWNPTAQQHGKDNPQGMHKGDLPNLLVGADGRGSFEYTIPNASVSGNSQNLLMDGDGATLMIHQQADDFRTDPSGSSGARIACGVLG